MTLRTRKPRKKGEPTIALINIVFLMLVFFLIAGTVAPPLDERVSLVDTADLEGSPPPDTAVVLPDGTLVLRGEPITPEDLITAERTDPDLMRLVPDRDLPAQMLLEITATLREGGIADVRLITQRGMQ
ncbi:biopolymer transporter ExbD [Yoonia sp. BS5-3]|uniref:ExbD/TolR family protein n=1 Tax=Yoonia phaeophyticola TaxID=3137369 RepID=A0ABZ2UZI9_9RHOB